jgi:FkbM family methyltransferase
MMSYFLQIFQTRSFRLEPISTVYRAISWIVLYILPKRTARVVIPVGKTSFKLDLPPLLRQGGSTGIFVQRVHYEPLLEYCDRLIKPGDVVFDCGANQGIYTCAFAALTGPLGRVIALEPQEYAIQALRNNLLINQFDHVSVQQVAASDQAGTAILDVSRGAVSASIARDFGRKGSFSVPTVTLSALAETLGIDRLNVLKMDIEGAEYLALLGAESLLTKYKPLVILEATPQEDAWLKVMALLKGHGYKPFLFGPEGDLVPVTNVGGYSPDVIFLAE